MATTDPTDRAKKRALRGKVPKRKIPANVPAEAPLTDAQERFCQEYIIDFNGRRSAQAAGYSARTARAIACNLLQQPNIQRRTRELIDARNARLQIDQDRVVQEIAAVAFSNPAGAMEFGPKGVVVKDSSELPPEVLAAIAEVSQTETRYGTNVSIKFHSKVSALDMLFRHLGLYAPEKIELIKSHEEALAELEGEPEGEPAGEE